MIHNNRTIKEPGDKSSFKVPDGYFESLASRIDELIDEADAQKGKVAEKDTGLNKYRMLTLRPLLYMAAMFVVLLFSFTAVLKYATKDKQPAGLTSTSTTDGKQVLTAEDYLINSIGTYAITEYYIDPEIFEE